MFLPYGIPGIDDDKIRINRKNMLSEARKKLENSNDDHWLQLISRIEAENRRKTSDPVKKGLPFTDIYIAGPEFSLQTSLPAALLPHFSFAAYAEIEPLIYSKWANRPYLVIKLDPEKPRVMQGIGYQIHETDLRIPLGLKNSFGNSLEDFTHASVLEAVDRNRRPSTDLEKSDFGGYFGYSSRKKTHKETNTDYWLMIVSELFRENMKDYDLATFVVGTPEVCKNFIEMNRKSVFENAEILPVKLNEDDHELVRQVLHRIVEVKLESSLREMNSQRVLDNLNDVVELLDSGNIRKIFVQQHDLFGENSVGDGQYEYSNPRSVILANALKSNAQVEYTRNLIDNKHGLAGVAY